jgi:6-pyruvoyltetrahydropterin/6-carboxytetrahydropterin synthase
MEVTKVVEFDMGHRVPNHKSKCRNPHGHRYRFELTICGGIMEDRGVSSEGMVIDFGDIKALMMEYIHDVLDHGFMIYEQDSELIACFFDGYNGEPINWDWNIIKVPFVPTAENIIQWCVNQLCGKLPEGVYMSRARLYETPNSWADWSAS